MRRRNVPFLVLELNSMTVEANRTVLPIELGDAMQREVLLHARLGQALAFVVTPPDPQVCRAMIELAAQIAPNVPVIARSRYGIYAEHLRRAGASIVVNEERMVGLKLAEETVGLLEARGLQQADANATID
jgi:CPA2 family monovalent cation:H+ antiporter-2